MRMKLISKTHLFFVVLYLVSFSMKAQINTFPHEMSTKNTGSFIKGAKAPEFSFYLPGKAGDIKFGLIQGDTSVWLSDLHTTCTLYKNGLKYLVSGGLLKQGRLTFTALPLFQTDGLIIQIQGEQLPEGIQLFWAFGGASGKLILQSDPGLMDADCHDNVCVHERNAEILYYPTAPKFNVFHALFPIQTQSEISDAKQQTSPLSFAHSGKETDVPAFTGMFLLQNGMKYYVALYRPSNAFDVNYYMLSSIFQTLEIKKATAEAK